MSVGPSPGDLPTTLPEIVVGDCPFRVANADNNNVAMIDVANRKEPRVLGFIPTGWYPTAVAISPDGRQIYVGTGKGMGFRNNYPAATRYQQKAPDPKMPYDYIAGILSGHVSVVNVPDPVLGDRDLSTTDGDYGDGEAA